MADDDSAKLESVCTTNRAFTRKQGFPMCGTTVAIITPYTHARVERQRSQALRFFCKVIVYGHWSVQSMCSLTT